MAPKTTTQTKIDTNSLADKIAAALTRDRDRKTNDADESFLQDLKSKYTRARTALAGPYRLTAQDLLEEKPEAFEELSRLYAADGGWRSDNVSPLFIRASDRALDCPIQTAALAADGREYASIGWCERSTIEKWTASHRYAPEQVETLLRVIPHRVILVTGPGNREHVIFTQLRGDGGEWSRWSPDISDARLRELAERTERAAADRAAEVRATQNFRKQIDSDPSALLRLAQALGLADAAGNLRKPTKVDPIKEVEEPQPETATETR